MKFAMLAIVTLGLAGAGTRGAKTPLKGGESLAAGLRSPGETEPRNRDSGLDEVPPPQPGAKYDLAATGVEWHRGLESVLGQKKPILLLQILGQYDDVYC